jgi:hypothetical protein
LHGFLLLERFKQGAFPVVEGVAEIDEIQGVILVGKTVGPIDLKSIGPF